MIKYDHNSWGFNIMKVFFFYFRYHHQSLYVHKVLFFFLNVSCSIIISSESIDSFLRTMKYTILTIWNLRNQC